jgi:hypothetical protein
MFARRSSPSRIWLIPATFALALFAGQAFADPPSRVARLSYLGGDVSFQPAGVNEWSEASLNRPLITGDSLHADRGSRVEMEIGAASIRLDESTSFNLLNLDDNAAQIELTEGVLNLRVKRVFDGQTYEIDTPTLALVIDRPGQYRVDIAPDGASTMVTVVDGSANVYGQNNASYSVRGGQSYRFNDSSLRDYEVLDLPRQDDFDRWCFERDARYERSVSRQYVSDEVIGYADLDDYGSWSTAETYGSIWYPSRVEAGWAPYRSGRWSWIDPWGWTWVDNSAWGFAPFHYGRWAYVGSRWGWVPGPRAVRPIYAPALVAFVGGGNFGVSISAGGGGPVGWFPLGPRDVYVPWYRGSRNYFNNINVRNTTIINNTYITNVYNDYSRGRPINNFNYAYRNNERAFTAVPRDTFINSRAVDRSRMQVNQAQLARGQVLSRVDVAPVAASMVGGGQARGGRGPSAASDRQVIARTAPPPRAANMQTRIQAIERNGNQPLAIGEMRNLSGGGPRANDQRVQRVQVVGGGQGQAAVRPQPLPGRAAADRAGGNEPGNRSPVPGRDAGRAAVDARTQKPGDNNSRIAPVRSAPSSDNARTPVVAPSVSRDRAIAPTDGERQLPSSRYAPGRDRNDGAGNPAQRMERVAPTVRDTPQARQPAEIRNRTDNSDARGITIPQRQMAPRNEPAPAVRAPQQNAPAIDRSRAIEQQPRREVQQAPQRTRDTMRQDAPVQRAEPVRREQPRMDERRVQPERQIEQRAAPQPQQQREVQQIQRQPRNNDRPQQQESQKEDKQERKRRDEN